VSGPKDNLKKESIYSPLGAQNKLCGAPKDDMNLVAHASARGQRKDAPSSGKTSLFGQRKGTYSRQGHEPAGAETKSSTDETPKIAPHSSIK